jgi:hypothetical protein
MVLLRAEAARVEVIQEVAAAAAMTDHLAHPVPGRQDHMEVQVLVHHEVLHQEAEAGNNLLPPSFF